MTANSDGIRRVLVPGLPVPKGAYVHAVVHADVAYCSGQLGTDPESGELVAGVAAQTTRALQNLAAVLEGIGSDLSRTLRCHVYLRNPSSFADMDAAYAQAFGEHRPARTTLPGIGFRGDVEVEIDLTAAMRQAPSG